jgi:hypothetical protein
MIILKRFPEIERPVSEGPSCHWYSRFMSQLVGGRQKVD